MTLIKYKECTQNYNIIAAIKKLGFKGGQVIGYKMKEGLFVQNNVQELNILHKIMNIILGVQIGQGEWIAVMKYHEVIFHENFTEKCKQM